MKTYYTIREKIQIEFLGIERLNKLNFDSKYCFYFVETNVCIYILNNQCKTKYALILFYKMLTLFYTLLYKYSIIKLTVFNYSLMILIL